MNSLLEQLHDIEGVDQVSAWPLALGWWALIAFGILISVLIIWLVISLIVFKRSWKSDTLRKLAHLEKGLTDSTARDTVITLSEYLRRIALQRYSRNECAGLTGIAWLKWLREHDPKKFDWEKRGTLLVNVPYAPDHSELSSSKIKNLNLKSEGSARQEMRLEPIDERVDYKSKDGVSWPDPVAVSMLIQAVRNWVH